MLPALKTIFFATPHRPLAWLAAVTAAMLGYGMYLQYAVGLVPCPMCIVQRYLYLLIFLTALCGAMVRKKWAVMGLWGWILVWAAAGIYVAARQSWLQWYPPEFYSCGRDFYGMIEQMPLSKALPRIFAGGGDCTAVDWTFLGGTLANWSLLTYSAITVLAVVCMVALLKGSSPPAQDATRQG